MTRALAAAAAGVLLWACSGPEPGATGVRGPDPATFPPCADMLIGQCGSLDCHGQPGRNLRLWGRDGMRLAPGDIPGEGSTTGDEYARSYWSVVGLEPELMDAVVRENGERPERLTLVRKARGTEKHKGGKIAVAGDDLDRCLVSWLAGQVDLEACARATLLIE